MPSDFFSYIQQQLGSNLPSSANGQVLPDVIDPLTGRPINTKGLGAGNTEAQDYLARAFAQDTMLQKGKDAAINTLQSGMNDPLIKQLTDYYLKPGADEEMFRLMFARGADAAATDSTETARQVAASMGARGINPSSALGAGLASEIESARSSAVRGVERDVRIEALKNQAVKHAQAFQLATLKNNTLGNIANIQMMVPDEGLKAMQGLPELRLEKYYIDKAAKNAKKAGQNSLAGALAGGLGSVASGIFGGI